MACNKEFGYIFFKGNWYGVIPPGGITEIVIKVLINIKILDNILKEVYKVQFFEVKTGVIACVNSLVQLLRKGKGYLYEFYLLEIYLYPIVKLQIQVSNSRF